MDVTLTQESSIMIKAEVKVPWNDVADVYNKTLRDLGKQAQLPGFRKGKTPAALIKKRFKPQIMHELSRSVLPESIEKMIAENKIKSVGQPRLLDMDIVEKTHLMYVLELDTLPEFELQDYKGLEAETLKVEVTDEMVAEDLDNQIKQATNKEVIEDRAAQDGETVVISLTAIDTDSEETLTDLDRYQITVGAEDAHPDLVKVIADMKTEDDTAYTFTASEDDPFEDWRGKNIKVYIEVSEIFKMEEPALDDAFAKEKGAESLEEYKQQVADRLRKSSEEAETNRLDSVLVESLIKPYDFELPIDMVLEEAKNMVQAQIMPYMNMMQGQDQRMQQEMIQGMIQHMMDPAETKVKADLILEKIADSLKLEATEEELTQDLENYLEYSEQNTVEELRADLEERGAMESLKTMIVRRKAMEAVREAASLTEVDELTKVEEPEPHVHGPDCDHDHDHDHAEDQEAASADSEDAKPEA